MAEYKEDISKKLAEKKEQDAKNAKEDAVIEAIIEDAQMEIPDAMIVTQQRQMIDDFAQRLQMQGMKLDMYCQYTGQTPASMLESVKPQALKRIQSRLVLLCPNPFTAIRTAPVPTIAPICSGSFFACNAFR